MLALCSCSEEGENISTEDNLIEITFATDWKAQAEQGGFYQALAAGLYEKNGLKVMIITNPIDIPIQFPYTNPIARKGYLTTLCTFAASSSSTPRLNP